MCRSWQQQINANILSVVGLGTHLFVIYLSVVRRICVANHNWVVAVAKK